MTKITCESKPRSFVRSSMHPSTGKWLTIGGAVVYYARAAHAFIVGIIVGTVHLSTEALVPSNISFGL